MVWVREADAEAEEERHRGRCRHVQIDAAQLRDEVQRAALEGHVGQRQDVPVAQRAHDAHLTQHAAHHTPIFADVHLCVSVCMSGV